MKFIADFYSFKLDLQKYKRVLLNTLRNMNERAGQIWIDVAVNKTPIPTWSGASRATFQQLASELGTTVPIGPIVANTNRVALGRATSDSKVIEDSNSFYVGFVYSTNLRYLRYNEYNRAVAGPPPQPFSNSVRFTPYNFQGRAARAWRKEAKQAKLPNPYRYIIKRKM